MTRISQSLSKLPGVISALLALCAYLFLNLSSASREASDFFYALGSHFPIELIPLGLFVPQPFSKAEGDGGYQCERDRADADIPRHCGQEE